MANTKKESPFIDIVAITGAMIVGVVAVILLFADGDGTIPLVIAAVGGLTILGCVLGYFAYKK